MAEDAISPPDKTAVTAPRVITILGITWRAFLYFFQHKPIVLALISDLFFNLADFRQPEILGIAYCLGLGDGSFQCFLQGAEGPMATGSPKTFCI